MMRSVETPRSPSPSQRFASGPSLSPRRGVFAPAFGSPLLGEREGPAKREGEGEALIAQNVPAIRSGGSP